MPMTMATANRRAAVQQVAGETTVAASAVRGRWRGREAVLHGAGRGA